MIKKKTVITIWSDVDSHSDRQLHNSVHDTKNIMDFFDIEDYSIEEEIVRNAEDCPEWNLLQHNKLAERY